MTENDSHNIEQQQLSTTQKTFISALLTPLPVVAAAKCAGVSEKTGHRWLKLASIQQSLKEAQRSLFDQALTGLMSKADKAIETLDRNMTGELVPANVQVRSAQIVLEMALQVHKVAELEERLKDLEQLVKDRQV